MIRQINIITGEEVTIPLTAEQIAANEIVRDTELKNQRIASIKKQLNDLDIKRIRPMCENDAQYLAALNGEISVLREELRGLL